jgi:hypothetical protein
MKCKSFILSLTVFVEPAMYQAVKLESERRHISICELIRIMIAQYFENGGKQ